MPLRNDDKTWVRGEIDTAIREAIDSFAPHGWRRLTHWLKEWGITGAVITSFIAMLGITIGALIQSFAHIKDETQFRTRTEDRLDKIEHDRLANIENRLQRIEDNLLALRASMAAIDPNDKRNQQEVKNIFEDAEKTSIHLPENIVQDIGGKFLDASTKNNQIWPVVEDVLAYRTFLNLSFMPAVGSPTRLDLTPKWSKYMESVKVRLNPAHPETHPAFEMFYAGGHTTPENSAHYELINKPQSEASGIAFFILNGLSDTIVLDGTRIKNVIIRNADVEYSGGPLVLENVYFVNCTFVSFRMTPESVGLGKSILASASISFTVTKKG